MSAFDGWVPHDVLVYEHTPAQEQHDETEALPAFSVKCEVSDESVFMTGGNEGGGEPKVARKRKQNEIDDSFAPTTSNGVRIKSEPIDILNDMTYGSWSTNEPRLSASHLLSNAAETSSIISAVAKRSLHVCCKCEEVLPTFQALREHFTREHVNLETDTCPACGTALKRRWFPAWMIHLLDDCESEHAAETLAMLLRNEDGSFVCVACEGAAPALCGFHASSDGTAEKKPVMPKTIKRSQKRPEERQRPPSPKTVQADAIRAAAVLRVCYKCDEVFPTFRLLRQHFLREHMNHTTNACPACEVELPERSFGAWRQHLSVKCPREYAKDTLALVMPDDEREKMYACAMCESWTANFWTFVKHTKTCCVQPARKLMNGVKRSKTGIALRSADCEDT